MLIYPLTQLGCHVQFQVQVCYAPPAHEFVDSHQSTHLLKIAKHHALTNRAWRGDLSLGTNH